VWDVEMELKFSLQNGQFACQNSSIFFLRHYPVLGIHLLKNSGRFYISVYKKEFK
jgi:hypothetical protein